MQHNMFKRTHPVFQQIESAIREEGAQSEILSLTTIKLWSKYKPLSEYYKNKIKPIDSVKHPRYYSFKKFWCCFKKDIKKKLDSTIDSPCKSDLSLSITLSKYI